MKVQFTYADLIKLARDHYQWPDSIKIEIVPTDDEGMPPIDTETQAVRGLRLAIGAMIKEFPRFDRDQKIPAIRRIRDIVGYGLADSKFIVENPRQAVKNLREFQCIRP